MATSILKGTLPRHLDAKQPVAVTPLDAKQPVAVTPSVKFTDDSAINGKPNTNHATKGRDNKITQFFHHVCSPLESCRKRTLKRVHCRSVLVAICALVVIECICVLSELMIDLQGIKFRFENEAHEINKFVDHFRRKYPEAFEQVDIRRTKDFVQLLKTSVVYRTSGDVLSRSGCPVNHESDLAFTTELPTPFTSSSSGVSTPAIDKQKSKDIKSDAKSIHRGLIPITITTSHPLLTGISDNDIHMEKKITSHVPFELIPDKQKSKQNGSLNNNNNNNMSRYSLHSGGHEMITNTTKHPLLKGINDDMEPNMKTVTTNPILSEIINATKATTAGSVQKAKSGGVPGDRPNKNSEHNSTDGAAIANAIRNDGRNDDGGRSVQNGNHIVKNDTSRKHNTNQSRTVKSKDTPGANFSDDWNLTGIKKSQVSKISSATNNILNVDRTNTIEPSKNSATQDQSGEHIIPQTADVYESNGSALPDVRMKRSTIFNNENDSFLDSLSNFFILEINNDKENFFLLMELLPERIKDNATKYLKYKDEYKKIYTASKALHFTSLSILGIMVIETFGFTIFSFLFLCHQTIVKLFCTGFAFFKKKLEVFDALIVVSSFILDVMFLDSRWYETGKDATALLVLLLPWRVVRIVNSFLMTVKHKHHLQMMNLKRGKKKAEIKMAKLQTLLTEIRKDVQLLTNLCRFHDVDENSINACLYGKGRRGATLDAMTTCMSLMLISTLGKDTLSQEEDVYSTVIKEVLNDGASTTKDQGRKEAEEAALDAAIAMDEKIEAKRKSRRPSRLKRALLKRSYTIPRRCASVEIPASVEGISAGNNVFYIQETDKDCSSRPESTFVVVGYDNTVSNDDVFFVSDDGGSAESNIRPNVSAL